MMLEWFAGNRDEAESHRLIADRVLRDQGMDNLEAWLEWAHAAFALGRGELAAGRAHAASAVGISDRIGDVLIAAMGEPLLASAELWLGEHQQRPMIGSTAYDYRGSRTG